MSAQPDAVQSVADRVDRLFRERTEGGREPSYQEVAQGLAALGFAVSAQALWDLRNGRTRQPRWALVVALARYFGVPLEYFAPDQADEGRLERQRLAAMLEREGVAEIARAAARLGPGARRALMAMIEPLEELERSTGGARG